MLIIPCEYESSTLVKWGMSETIGLILIVVEIIGAMFERIFPMY